MPGSLTLSKCALHAGPDGYLIEVGQFTGLLHGKFTAKRRRTSLAWNRNSSRTSRFISFSSDYARSSQCRIDPSNGQSPVV
jgi:hypothetical protein